MHACSGWVAQAFVLVLASGTALADDTPVPVNATNFVRAETDLYLSKSAAGIGEFQHRRQMADIDHQDVVRMNRDTLYSSALFDLQAGPVTITLPDTGKRFMSMQAVSQDHYTPAVVYAPGTFTFTQEQVGTRYVQMIVRTLANPEDPKDMAAVHALQDQIKVQQAGRGKFEAPNWDAATRDRARNALKELGALGGSWNFFGKPGEVSQVDHLIGAAVGWGGNPPSAAKYEGVFPAANDGRTVHALTVKDVPVDGFWSISVYDKDGYFARNELGAYSTNNLTARPNADGSFTVQFGGCAKTTRNCLPVTPGWNYTVRLYRPRPEILDGTWQFPKAAPRD